VISVAADDQFTSKATISPSLSPGHKRRFVYVVNRDVGGFVDDAESAFVSRFSKVLHDFGLSVDRDRSFHEPGEVDAKEFAIEGYVCPHVNQALALHARVDAQSPEQIDGCPFEHAGAHAPLDVRAPMLLQDDAGNAGLMENEREQKPCRARSNNGDLGLQADFPRPEYFPEIL
jgi:hypothetical protein